ncbi:hypothetical protein [Arthrobacter russicus]|uniref:DUF4262 domain-containing protein n=1 Tax=Arthrobacter russicus TaxID=172040 RepID=A0ABU1J962_9MICC|nr:hypothetical protein [Arthrobacter russicus]MDR6268918.1 hypothetical protein [Arthrobacter russicus]
MEGGSVDFEKEFLTGLAQMIADSNIAVYRPDGVYAEGEAGIVFGFWPQSPDACIVLNLTPLSDESMINFSRYILEVHARGAKGDPFGASGLAVPVFDLIHGARNLEVGKIQVTQILRNGGSPLEQDGSRRAKRADNYVVWMDTNPTQYRSINGWD